MANLVAFQVAITGSAQQLASNPLVNGVTILAKSTNTANVEITAVTNASTTVGAILEKGTSVFIPLKNGNTNQIFVFGTTSDIISVIGS